MKSSKPEAPRGDATVAAPEGMANFELSFSPNQRLVSMVRRFVSSFYEQVLNDPVATSKLALATHELLDNAVKYSNDGNTRVRVGVARDEASGTYSVAVETWNVASPENIESLAALLGEITGASDIDSMYQTLLMRSAKRTDGSGLGLCRILAEADMTVAHAVEGHEVRIEARGRFESAEGT